MRPPVALDEDALFQRIGEALQFPRFDQQVSELLKLGLPEAVIRETLSLKDGMPPENAEEFFFRAVSGWLKNEPRDTVEWVMRHNRHGKFDQAVIFIFKRVSSELFLNGEQTPLPFAVAGLADYYRNDFPDKALKARIVTELLPQEPGEIGDFHHNQASVQFFIVCRLAPEAAREWLRENFGQLDEKRKKNAGSLAAVATAASALFDGVAIDVDAFEFPDARSRDDFLRDTALLMLNPLIDSEVVLGDLEQMRKADSDMSAAVESLAREIQDPRTRDMVLVELLCKEAAAGPLDLETVRGGLSRLSDKNVAMYYLGRMAGNCEAEQLNDLWKLGLDKGVADDPSQFAMRLVVSRHAYGSSDDFEGSGRFIMEAVRNGEIDITTASSSLYSSFVRKWQRQSPAAASAWERSLYSMSPPQKR